jgi:outer membrane protein assembly factor BamB
MIKKITKFLLVILIISSCTKIDNLEDKNIGFPVLSYDAQISETLNLDLSNVKIDPPKENLFWAQHFLNPSNNLNNISTTASFNNKSRVISGKRGPVNIIQPIYFSNNVCYVLNDGYLNCIDAKTNEIIFNVNIKPAGINKYEVIRGGIAYFDDQLVFVDAYGQIKLFNVENGNEIWSSQIDYPILSPPLIYRGYIYFISADNRIFSIKIDDGSINWTFQTISETKKNLYTSSPVAFENAIIVPFSNGELVSFIYDTGQPLWSENLSKVSMVSNFDIKDISASPVISDTNVFSLSSNGRLISNNVITGKRNWSIDISGYRTPLISGNQIYLINDDGKLICIDKLSSEIYWITDLSKYRKGQKAENLNLWLGPYLINSLIYNISYFGEVKIVSPITGEILSTDTIGVKDINVPPIIISDSIFMTDENSNVFKFE